MSLISSNLLKKYIPSCPAIYSLTTMPKTSPFVPTIKLAKNPPQVHLTTQPEHEFSVPQELPSTPNVPDFDPDKPSDPPPLSPNPTPEFPGPAKPDPEIQPPGPDMPVPPNMPPSGPEVVPPTVPEWMPPTPPENPLPYP
ncbi:hypothetical protein CTI12_AA315570 [Artemisia annua]|uniref:Uncharacterized protein n=1 Tax=Artemisia annua TaxID=35608 RepID=A0A2U1N2Z5_ARTAN|nr:hypothetical protein CTI12_AA315570 [Artemisia annua]